MLNSKAFQAALWVLLIFLIILVGTNISFIFRPIVVLISTIFFPVLIAGILYYLTSPIVNWLHSKRIPKVLAILFIYMVLLGILTLIILYIGPIIQLQLLNLIENAPRFLSQLHRTFIDFQESTIFERFQETDSFERWRTVDYAAEVEKLVSRAIDQTYYLIGFITNILIIFITIPFILFYMLKDGHKLPKAIVKYLPSKYQDEGLQILIQMNKTISSFIQGQLIVSFFVGFMVYLAYMIIGLEYALLLALIAMVANVVPYFGPIIGTIPGMIVGLIQSPWTALQVLFFVFIIQQIESQLIAPQVFGRKLAIHPVTIIVVLLTAGSLAGILGMILAIPTYAVGKVVVVNLLSLIRLRMAEGAEEK